MSKLLLAAAVLLLATPALAFSVDTQSADQPIRINPVYAVQLADGSSEDVVQLPSSVSFHLSVVRDHIAHADLPAGPATRLDPDYDPAFAPTREAVLPAAETTLQTDTDPELLVISGSGIDPNVLAEHLR